MRALLTLAAVVALPVATLSAEPDRSTPEAAFEVLRAAHLQQDEATIAECLTPDSQERTAAEKLAMLMVVRDRLAKGPAHLRTAMWDIDLLLSEHGIVKKHWGAALATANHRPQTTPLLVVALVLTNVDHKPRFVAAANRVLLDISRKSGRPLQPPNADVSLWKGLRVTDQNGEGDEVVLSAASESGDQKLSFEYHKVGEKWLLARPNPLPQEIHRIVHATAETLVEPPPTGIEVNDSTTETPEAVYSLAREALAKEDFRAFAECLTADSLEVNAVMTLVHAQAALKDEETPDAVRQRVKQAFHTAGVDEDSLTRTVQATVTDYLKNGGDQDEARATVAQLLSSLPDVIKNKPRFCAEVQIVLLPISHGEPMYELMHLRHSVTKLGQQLKEVKEETEGSTTGTIVRKDGQAGELEFVHTDDGWRIAMPVPLAGSKYLMSSESK